MVVQTKYNEPRIIFYYYYFLLILHPIRMCHRIDDIAPVHMYIYTTRIHTAGHSGNRVPGVLLLLCTHKHVSTITVKIDRNSIIHFAHDVIRIKQIIKNDNGRKKSEDSWTLLISERHQNLIFLYY